MIAQHISSKIKSFLDGFDEASIYKQMLGLYKLIHLIDEKNKWAIPELERHSSYLLPKNITSENSKEFVDEMAEIALKNQYLAQFIKESGKENFEILSSKLELEGDEVIPDVIAYALLLERMTKVMYDDPKLTESCLKHFKKVRKREKLFRKMNLFFFVKLLSLEGSLDKVFLKCHRTGKVPPDSLRIMLPLNIIEAGITDYVNGYKNNAKTSLILSKNKPGTKHFNPATGAGPARWSDDKKAVWLFIPRPKEWADLYQTWNMAFVSGRKLFPYFIAKLAIPQVANYEDKPQEYINRRVLALYITLFFGAFKTIHAQENNVKEFDWRDENLTRFWGKINLGSAKQYQMKIKT